jgi:hypothetical protein
VRRLPCQLAQHHCLLLLLLRLVGQQQQQLVILAEPELQCFAAEVAAAVAAGLLSHCAAQHTGDACALSAAESWQLAQVSHQHCPQQQQQQQESLFLRHCLPVQC